MVAGCENGSPDHSATFVIDLNTDFLQDLHFLNADLALYRNIAFMGPLSVNAANGPVMPSVQVCTLGKVG